MFQLSIHNATYSCICTFYMRVVFLIDNPSSRLVASMSTIIDRHQPCPQPSKPVLLATSASPARLNLPWVHYDQGLHARPHHHPHWWAPLPRAPTPSGSPVTAAPSPQGTSTGWHRSSSDSPDDRLCRSRRRRWRPSGHWWIPPPSSPAARSPGTSGSHPRGALANLSRVALVLTPTTNKSNHHC